MEETHPLFSPEVRDYWAKKGMQTWGDPTPPGRSAEFYHASRRDLGNATHIDADQRRGSSSGSADDVNWFSSTPPEHAARNYGRNVYRVEPTGQFTDNFDTPGQFASEYASEHPLRIISKVQFGGGA